MSERESAIVLRAPTNESERARAPASELRVSSRYVKVCACVRWLPWVTEREGVRCSAVSAARPTAWTRSLGTV